MAIPLFIAACVVPDGGLFRAERFRDVHVYGRYADAFLDGGIPYRDFFVEYPPGAFAVFLPPALLDSGLYNFAFKSLMALCGAATIFLLGLVLVSLGASRGRLYAAVLLVALSPIALGPISLNTYDAWPALLTVASLAALLRGRERLAFGALSLAFTAKVYPLVLLPLASIYVWRTSGPRRLPGLLLLFAGIAVAVAGPFALLAPGGLAESFESQAGRALQIESLGAALLLAAHRLGLYEASVVQGSTEAISRDLGGSPATVLAVGSSVLQACAVAAVAVLLARGRNDAERLAVAFAAAVAGFLVFTRFFSPQYLVWLVPLVPLAAGLSGLAASALLLTALALGQLWFFHYREVFELSSIVWLVVLRDAVVLLLLLVLLVRLVPRGRHA